MITGLQARQQVIDTSMMILYQAIDQNEKEIIGLQQMLAEAHKHIAQLEAQIAGKPADLATLPAPTFSAEETPAAKPNGKEK